MAELGLNVYQVIQNELLARENNRSTLGLGFRLAIIETQIQNAQNVARNGRIWRLNHSIAPIRALTPESRIAAKKREEKVLRLKEGDRHRDPKDPTKLIRDEERWEVCRYFPRTLLEFKELQFEPKKLCTLMEFYDVPVYNSDQQLIDYDEDDGVNDVSMNMQACMEELAMTWGLNWHCIDGLSLPSVVPVQPIYNNGLSFSQTSFGDNSYGTGPPTGRGP